MKNLLLVDTSYLIFYRFFALRIWYKKANSDFIQSFSIEPTHLKLATRDTPTRRVNYKLFHTHLLCT